VWCLEISKISVFDPACHGGNFEDTKAEHRYIVDLVKNAIQAVCCIYYLIPTMSHESIFKYKNIFWIGSESNATELLSCS
jgi:hypothetical protein